MQKFRDLVFVITGASGPIGRATALEVARRGGRIVLAAPERRVLREVAAECQKLGARALAVPTDLADARTAERLAEEAFKTFGHIDVWVNNAESTPEDRFEETPSGAYHKVVESTFFGCIHGARAALPYFRSQRRGILINCSSHLGKVGIPLATAYAASQFAIRGWADSLRRELRDAPTIRVCTIVGFPVEHPERVVSAILKCAVRPKSEVRIRKTGRLFAVGRLLAPRLTRSAISDQLGAKEVESDRLVDREDDLSEPMSETRAVANQPQDDGKKSRKMALTGLVITAAGAAAWLLRSGPEGESRRASERIRAAREELEKRAIETRPGVSDGHRETAPAKRAGSPAQRKAGSQATSESRAKSLARASVGRQAVAKEAGKGSRSRSRSATRSRRG